MACLWALAPFAHRQRLAAALDAGQALSAAFSLQIAAAMLVRAAVAVAMPTWAVTVLALSAVGLALSSRRISDTIAAAVALVWALCHTEAGSGDDDSDSGASQQQTQGLAATAAAAVAFATASPCEHCIIKVVFTSL